MNKKLAVLDMRDLSAEQFNALRNLKVTERQEVSGKSFLESIQDWERAAKDQTLGLCFLLNECPIGLVIFRKQLPIEANRISVHGLKIALPWQQQGYGHQAFKAGVECVRSHWAHAQTLTLAVDAENTPAVAIYRKFGMRDSGPVFDGPNGKEHRMELVLRA